MATGTAVEIRESTLDALLAAGEVLFRQHWQEVALHKDLMKLDPDILRYKAHEQQGNLLILTASEDGVLFGYSVSLIITHPHYSSLLFAQNDVLYVDPQHRKSRLGAQLILSTESHARNLGAQMMCWHAKEGSELDSILDRSQSYDVQDIIYSRRL